MKDRGRKKWEEEQTRDEIWEEEIARCFSQEQVIRPTQSPE